MSLQPACGGAEPSRAGRPLDLLIEQVDEGFNWISHGSAAEVARQQAMELILDKLPERQSDALRVMTHHWVTTQQGMDRPHLGAALGLDRKRSKEVMDALLQKKLIQFEQERPARGDGRGQPTRLFRPVDAVLPFFPATDLSDISDPVSPPASKPPSERSEKSMPQKNGSVLSAARPSRPTLEGGRASTAAPDAKTGRPVALGVTA